MPVDLSQKPIDSNKAIQINYRTCIGCQSCTVTAQETQQCNVFQLSARKLKPFVSVNGNVLVDSQRHFLADTSCYGCGNCIKTCPADAIQPKNDISAFKLLLKKPEILVVLVDLHCFQSLSKLYDNNLHAAKTVLFDYFSSLGIQRVFSTEIGYQMLFQQNITEYQCTAYQYMNNRQLVNPITLSFEHYNRQFPGYKFVVLTTCTAQKQYQMVDLTLTPFEINHLLKDFQTKNELKLTENELLFQKEGFIMHQLSQSNGNILLMQDPKSGQKIIEFSESSITAIGPDAVRKAKQLDYQHIEKVMCVGGCGCGYGGILKQ